jgi:SAM-dependent methyltransferase
VVNQDQRAYWNAEAGQSWAAEAARLDVLLAPFATLALEALAPPAGERVLDIGCGAGATTRALAAMGCDAVGVDVSAPLLATAERLGGGARYLLADAGVDPLPGPFDGAISRFGVMFFEDPPAAFAHIRAAMKPGGRLSFVCWGPLEENAWATAPMAAAAPHLPALPPPPPVGAPGPFGLSRPGQAEAILAAAGWRAAKATAWKGKYSLGASPEDAVDMALKIGPLARVLRENPNARASVLPDLLNLFRRHHSQSCVQFAASIWIVTAKQ